MAVKTFKFNNLILIYNVLNYSLFFPNRLYFIEKQFIFSFTIQLFYAENMITPTLRANFV